MNRFCFISVYLYLLLLMLNPLAVLGQGCENYVVTRTMLNATGSQYTDKVDYYDGLGRPIETVLRNITPQGNSIVTLQEYDSQSRPVKAWQPVVSSVQGFVPAATVAALSAAQYGDSHAYTTTIYEPSPTENVDASVRPGDNLADKPIITRRLVNDSTSELRCYDLRGTSVGSRRGILYKTASGVEYGHVDQLTFDYIGNQIDYVYENSEACDYEGATDFQEIPGSTTYQWDANGNMKRDPSRGITSITYYSTNQPRKITFDNGNSVSFQYDAAGNKQSMQYLVSDMSVALPGGMAQYGSYRRLRRDYIGNCVYRNDTIETIHTATGYIDGAGRYFHYLKDYQGNIRAVVSHSGQIMERNNYYPYGMLMPEDGNDAQSYKYGGKELYRMEGMNLYDFHARNQSATTLTFTTPDPKLEDYPGISPYAYCAGNPIMLIDPTGMDTINVTFSDGQFHIQPVIIAEGNDVFNITVNGETSSCEFTEGEYGDRINMLNIAVDDDENGLTLGIYHVSGASENGTGFYVVPGGEPSSKNGSGKRILDGVYPLLAPHESASWRKPGVGGDVVLRGIRIHYGGANLRNWTKGCFVVNSTYKIVKEKIIFNLEDSKQASKCVDALLGATKTGIVYPHNKKTRIGSNFGNGIKKKLILKTLN